MSRGTREIVVRPFGRGTPRFLLTVFNNYGSDRERFRAEKANKAARKSRQRNRR